MAYPMGFNPLNLGQFIERAKTEYGAKVVVEDVPGDGPTRYLERQDGDMTLYTVLPSHDDDVLLEGFLILSMCRRLGIPSSPFGVVLEDGLVKTVPPS